MTTSGGPYVGLDYFVEEDAELFFGRDDERKRIIGNLRASRLTLLYAESGVGKSSLLRAGVSARLRGSARYVPVVFSAWQGDATAGLIGALEDAVRPMAPGDGDIEVRRDALEHALEDVARTVEATPLLILDQFEEHFVQEPGDGFDDDLARCITRSDLRANVLISIREDAYSLLGQRFKATIPNVYGNYLHLDFLDERAARAAVLNPVLAYNERLATDEPAFEIEPDLVDAVLEQVRRGQVTIGDAGAPVRDSGPVRIETAYLQLVMKRLWDEEVARGSNRLRLQTLQRLGGADTIVRSHLDDVMSTLPAEQRDAAAAAFRFLVTSGGRKIALSTTELGEFSEAPEAPLDAALGHLENERILRRIPSPEPDGVPRREIYHDVLAPAILDWRRRHVDEQRRAETERGLTEARERARRLEVRSRRLAAAVISLAAVLVGLALYLLDPTPVRKLELSTIDARFGVRGEGAPDPRLVMISVDDRTLRRRADPADPRLPRQDYARLIRSLHRAGAGLIALDVLFSAEWTEGGDRALLRAFRATRDRLVLPFDTFVAVPGVGGGVRADLLDRPNRVSDTGARTGYAGLPQDVDGSHRRTDLLVDFVNEKPAEGDPRDSVRAPTFAFAAADLVRGGALSRRLDDVTTAEGREEGAQSDLTSWIDYRGPAGTIPRVSALDVLEGRRRPETFRDKLVVIGVIAEASEDVHRTPLDDGSPMPGAELQANAIDTLLRPSPLRDAPNPLDAIAMVLLACIPALAALRRSRRFPAIAIAVALIAFVAWAQLAFLLGWIVAVVVPLAAFLAATSGVAGVAAGRALRRRRASM